MKKNFQELINSEQPVLVDFYADWCGPCQAMTPVISEIAQNYGQKIKIIKVNVDKNPVAAQTYGISGIPAFIMFKNGEVIWRHNGMIPGFELKKVLDKFSM